MGMEVKNKSMIGNNLPTELLRTSEVLDGGEPRI